MQRHLVSLFATKCQACLDSGTRKRKEESGGEMDLGEDSDVENEGGGEQNQHRKHPPSQYIIHSPLSFLLAPVSVSVSFSISISISTSIVPNLS
ncbi:hypothetical protein BHE74_00024332 [Ensete ventricosum]|nr:hypothetical protein GW17_00043232 [Ensete ventricosum]RWW68151.1 hypothetical protein BHE74_00024332 [Ensete ventricosum]RZR82249.1 hypothetical protein BHM03_00008620 [Ensete ventricosum]